MSEQRPRPLDRIAAMSPYRPPLANRGAHTGLPLDFNERTIELPDEVRRALTRALEGQPPQMYPDYGDLERGLAEYAGVEREQVLVTNGSDAAIDIIVRTYCDRGDRAIIPQPSFVMFINSARIAGVEPVTPSYRAADMAYPVEEVLEAIDDATRLVFICNPNNPTGTAVELDDIARIAERARHAIVHVDEAYHEFSGRTAVGLLGTHPNIVITRTFSKAFGLAGLRVGYCLADSGHIDQLLKVRSPYGVTGLSYAAAAIALEHRAAMRGYADEVMGRSKPLLERFLAERGVFHFPSCANFLLARVDDAERFAAALAEAGVLVRPRSGPGIESTVRITIGTVEQTERLIAAWREVSR